MMFGVDRQLRNIALLTLLVAAMTIVAVVSPEHNRSATNTAILAFAVLAAVGSVLALALGSTWLRVVRMDVRRWREGPERKWNAHHYAPDDANETLLSIRRHFGPDESGVMAAGLPCLAVSLRPASLGFALERPLRDATVTCAVERRGGVLSRTRRAPITLAGDDSAGAVGRWPDEWLDADHVAPSPGRFRVRWTIKLPDGSVERPTEKLHVGAAGAHQVGRLRPALHTAKRLVNHLRGLDDGATPQT